MSTRRLVAQTDHASAFVTKISGQNWAPGRPSSVIIMQNLVPVCHTTWVYVGGPKNWGILGPNSLGIGICIILFKHAPPSRYHTEFGWSR